MTHLPYVVASYAMGFGVPIALGVMAALRLGRARRMLDAVDPRLNPRLGREDRHA